MRGAATILWCGVAAVCVAGGPVQAQATAAASGPGWWALVLTPMLTGAIGVAAAYLAIRFDARKTVNQELIKKRIVVYDTVVPKLNEMLCFFLSIGAWRLLTPPLMVQRKRELDQAFHIYGPLFAPEVFARYDVFIQICFLTYQGTGKAARLRADLAALRTEWGDDWQGEWDAAFVGDDAIAAEAEVRLAYDDLVACLAAQIGAAGRTGAIGTRRLR